MAGTPPPARPFDVALVASYCEKHGLSEDEVARRAGIQTALLRRFLAGELPANISRVLAVRVLANLRKEER